MECEEPTGGLTCSPWLIFFWQQWELKHLLIPFWLFIFISFYCSRLSSGVFRLFSMCFRMNLTLLFSCCRGAGWGGGGGNVLLIENAWVGSIQPGERHCQIQASSGHSEFSAGLWKHSSCGCEAQLCKTEQELELLPWWKRLIVPCGHSCGFAQCLPMPPWPGSGPGDAASWPARDLK